MYYNIFTVFLEELNNQIVKDKVGGIFSKNFKSSDTGDSKRKVQKNIFSISHILPDMLKPLFYLLWTKLALAALPCGVYI